MVVDAMADAAPSLRVATADVDKDGDMKDVDVDAAPSLQVAMVDVNVEADMQQMRGLEVEVDMK